MRCYSCRKYDDCELPWKCSSTMYDCSAYELEQTNEEWFVSLPTEEKAKTIICLAVNSMHKKRKGLIENDVNEIMQWLKEKHE